MKNRNLENHDNWATPKYLYERLNKEFNFDFDPCPLNSTFDGLDPNCKWGERNFINPPYSRKLKEAFIIRAFNEAQINNKLCVLLLPVSTSTAVFHNFIIGIAKIGFIRGRVKFEGINTKGEKVSTRCGMHDSMIVVYNGSLSKQFNNK